MANGAIQQPEAKNGDRAAVGGGGTESRSEFPDEDVGRSAYLDGTLPGMAGPSATQVPNAVVKDAIRRWIDRSILKGWCSTRRSTVCGGM